MRTEISMKEEKGHKDKTWQEEKSKE
jgi:hypothetical protein